MDGLFSPGRFRSEVLRYQRERFDYAAFPGLTKRTLRDRMIKSCALASIKRNATGHYAYITTQERP